MVVYIIFRNKVFMLSSQEYLVPETVAQLMRVPLSQVYTWIKTNDLKGNTITGEHPRFTLKEVKTFALSKNIELTNPDTQQRLLIVDDEPLYTVFLKDVLSTNYQELEIDICFNGFAAGLKINSFNPTVVLLDVMMPAIDGLQVCEQIKQDPLLQHTRVIVMSGGIDDNKKQRLIDAGAEAYFEKPIDIKQLMRQLNL
jgi:CheY-like chemotaxis protein